MDVLGRAAATVKVWGYVVSPGGRVEASAWFDPMWDDLYDVNGDGRTDQADIDARGGVARASRAQMLATVGEIQVDQNNQAKVCGTGRVDLWVRDAFKGQVDVVVADGWYGSGTKHVDEHRPFGGTPDYHPSFDEHPCKPLLYLP